MYEVWHNHIPASAPQSTHHPGPSYPSQFGVTLHVAYVTHQLPDLLEQPQIRVRGGSVLGKRLLDEPSLAAVSCESVLGY